MVPVCFNCLNSTSGECLLHHKQTFLTSITYLTAATSTIDEHESHKNVFYSRVRFWFLKKEIQICDDCRDISKRTRQSKWYIPKKEKIEIACYLGVITILATLFYFTVVK